MATIEVRCGFVDRPLNMLAEHRQDPPVRIAELSIGTLREDMREESKSFAQSPIRCVAFLCKLDK